MRRLWIADVHANLPAFLAVLKDVGEADEIVFLGDIIGAGPHPSECVDKLISIHPRAVIGNHDLVILSRKEYLDSSDGNASNWDEWAFLQLTPEHISYLESLPEIIEIDSCGRHVKALHRPPHSAYLHPDMPDYTLESCFKNVPGEMIICAHSHHPIDRQVGNRRFICIPSVGQPRNGDPRAGYAVEEDGRIHFRLTEYDVEKTVADTIKVSSQLGEAFPARWIDFVRTGVDIDTSRAWPK